MDIFLETYDLTKLNPEKIKNMSRTIASNEIGSIILKSHNKQKFQNQMASQVRYTRHLKWINVYPSQSIPENWRQKNASVFILWSWHCHNKMRQRHHKKKEKENFRIILKLSKTLWGPWAWKPFLFVRNRPKPLWHSLSSKGNTRTVANSERSGQETIWGKIKGIKESCQEDCLRPV